MTSPDSPLSGAPPDEVPFAAPWQARAFAMVVQLAERGVFTWSEWAQALSAEIAARPGQDYYAQWLAAAETLLVAKGLASAEQLEARRFGLAIVNRAREAAHARPPTGG